MNEQDEREKVIVELNKEIAVFESQGKDSFVVIQDMLIAERIVTHSLRSRIVELEAENKILRKLLWIRHGCSTSVLYGDDGEMQCGKCAIDFKRQTAQRIEARFDEIGLQALRESSPTTNGEQHG